LRYFDPSINIKSLTNRTISRVILFGTFVILSIIGIQTYWITSAWSFEEKEFDERVKVALYNVAKEFEKMGTQIPSYDLVRRVSNNYYVVNINDVINANNLEFFLRRELEALRLGEDFEYGIYDCVTDQMVYGDYVTNQDGLDSLTVKPRDLPIYDEYTYYFGVRFPSRNNHILSGMRPTLILSGILLVTILFFLYSMFIILRQRRLSEMQKDFINNMTHEFKTPISTIRVSADVFLSDPGIRENPRLLQYAGIIREQSLRLNSQVEKVLQLAQLERGNFQLNQEEVDLHALILKVLSTVRVKVDQAGGALEHQFHPGTPIVKADAFHLTNILHNVLDNAVKYCRDVPEISLQTAVQGNCVTISIQDQGIGISQEYLEKVFSKFYRIPTGNVHNVKGFGIGLYYVKSICKAQSWKLHLESTPGQGTCIKISIPLLNGSS
jgi:two-component system phosphate regulon sensor histidine kinase PhoR